MSSVRVRNGWAAESWAADYLRKEGWDVYHLAPSEAADLIALRKNPPNGRVTVRFIEVKSSTGRERVGVLSEPEELLRVRLQREGGIGIGHRIIRVWRPSPSEPFVLRFEA